MSTSSPTPEERKIGATCPTCARTNCPTRKQRTQATRTEPSRSLGFYGYCPDCQCSFRAASLYGVAS